MVRATGNGCFHISLGIDLLVYKMSAKADTFKYKIKKNNNCENE